MPPGATILSSDPERTAEGWESGWDPAEEFRVSFLFPFTSAEVRSQLLEVVCQNEFTKMMESKHQEARLESMKKPLEPTIARMTPIQQEIVLVKFFQGKTGADSLTE